MSDAIVSVRGVKRSFETAGGLVWALAGVDLDVWRGEHLALQGPSGSGKTTLFNILGGLDRPTHGAVSIEGRILNRLGKRDLAALRAREIGFVFQSFNLCEGMTAAENILVPQLLGGVSIAEARHRAMELLERVGLASWAHHFPWQLSGGQQQRVAFARALAVRPRLLLADEPTGNLDSAAGDALVGLLDDLREETGTTVICATHDPRLLEASDRTVALVEGRMQETGGAVAVVGSD